MHKIVENVELSNNNKNNENDQGFEHEELEPDGIDINQQGRSTAASTEESADVDTNSALEENAGQNNEPLTEIGDERDF